MRNVTNTLSGVNLNSVIEVESARKVATHFLILREAKASPDPPARVQARSRPSQDTVLGSELGHAQEEQRCLPSLFISKLVLKTPSGLGGERAIRLTKPPKWAKGWDGKCLFVMKILI